MHTQQFPRFSWVQKVKWSQGAKRTETDREGEREKANSEGLLFVITQKRAEIQMTNISKVFPKKI